MTTPSNPDLLITDRVASAVNAVRALPGYDFQAELDGENQPGEVQAAMVDIAAAHEVSFVALAEAVTQTERDEAENQLEEDILAYGGLLPFGETKADLKQD